MKGLPDCPQTGCDANQTLELVGVTRDGLRLCVCSCCGKSARVDLRGQVQPADRRDVRGVVMYDP